VNHAAICLKLSDDGQIGESLMTDRYTKTMLTIIATCLVALVVQNLPIWTTANAQNGPVPVWVNGWSLPMPLPVQIAR
jgi:hypothetical protein